MIFWHESSATEPGGTARDGRVHEPGGANIPAMSVARAAPLVSVSQAGRGRRGGSCDYYPYLTQASTTVATLRRRTAAVARVRYTAGATWQVACLFRARVGLFAGERKLRTLGPSRAEVSFAEDSRWREIDSNPRSPARVTTF